MVVGSCHKSTALREECGGLAKIVAGNGAIDETGDRAFLPVAYSVSATGCHCGMLLACKTICSTAGSRTNHWIHDSWDCSTIGAAVVSIDASVAISRTVHTIFPISCFTETVSAKISRRGAAVVCAGLAVLKSFTNTIIVTERRRIHK